MFRPEAEEIRAWFAAEIVASNYKDAPAANSLVLSRIVGLTGQSLPALAFDLDWLSADRRGLFVAPR
jgi:hypothetical protein